MKKARKQANLREISECLVYNFYKSIQMNRK